MAYTHINMIFKNESLYCYIILSAILKNFEFKKIQLDLVKVDPENFSFVNFTVKCAFIQRVLLRKIKYSTCTTYVKFSKHTF